MSTLSTISHPEKTAQRWVKQDAVIKITNLRLRTFIGFNPEEMTKQQDIVINAEIHYRADTAAQTDDETRALNYKVITKEMIRHVEDGRFKLLEKLAEDLLQIALSHDKVQLARVTVDKPHALRFADSVSLTLAAHREN